MSAVTRIIYTFFLLPMLVILSACSDSGSESEISIDDRRLNIDTPFSVLEGGDGDVSIIEVSFVSTVTGTISYSTFNVTAASRSDYIPVAGDIEVTEGVEYTINISIEGDDQIEGDELIGLSLTLNGEDLVTYYGRIENDDLPPVTIKTTSVLEGDTGTSLLRFTISLDEEVVDPYTFALVTPVVDVSLNDPENDIFYAIPDIDFEAIDQNITFTEGVSEISIDVVVLADNVIELDERVFIQLNPLQNGLSAEGLIRTDDAVDINGFDLSSVSSEILEGTSASVTDIEWGLVEYLVTVDRPENIIDEQVVQIKLIGKDEQLSDGSTDWASLGEDYCANPVLIDGVCDSVGSYVLEPGIDSTSLMVSFYVRKDLDVEESEEIEIQLQNDQGVVFGNFRHTIIQDDNPSLTVSYLDTSGILQTANLADLVLAAKNDGFTIEILEPADSDSQSVSSIWFNLDFPLKDEFKPSYEFSEVRVSQIGVSDYYVENAGAGVITFAENSTATTNIDVTALHDDDYEGREVLNLEIEDFGVIPITIIDNDLPILKITETTGADILRNDAHFSAITLSESLSANSSDATTTYNFNFALEGGIEALDDLNFSYEINDDFFTDNETAINNIAACTYLKDDNRNRKAIINGEEGATEVPDYQILIGGSELAPNTDYVFEKTKPKLEISMIVNNDVFVECLEFISLKFTLSPITNQADDETVLSSTIDVNFEITNTDKATLKVVGWNSDEGSSDQAPLATTTKNFSLELDQAIVTSDIQYTLTSSTNDALSCGDDLQGITVPYVNTVSFNGSDTDLNKAIGVLIQQDNIVEPEEACQLSITNMTSEDSAVIDVEYFNETGKNTGLYAVDLVNTYASGVIQNDDNLIVTVTTPADSTIEEPVTTGDTLSIGTYSWNKVIAANVGKIAVTATQQDCAADDECIDAADTSFGTHTNATPATKEMIIHTGAETEALAFEERSLPIIVNGDNEVENPENLTFNLAITSGNEYIDLANSNLSNRSIEVTSLDTLSVFLEENNALNTCGDDVISPVNSERDCERVFNIKFSEDISEDVMDLNVNLSIDTDDSDGSINTVNIKGAGSIDYVDAIIFIKENSSAAGYTEATPVENNVSINILQGGVVQEPSIKIAFVNDDVVEIDETLLLSLQAVGSNGFYGVDTSRDTISQFVNNDDKLTITYTQFDSFELNEAPDAQVQPYTYTWDKDIAPNVPTIQFAFEAFCDVAADHNCAESNNDFDIPSNNDLVTIHTETTSNYTEVPATALSLGVYYMLDTRVEEDEVLEIEVSKLGNSSVLTSTEGQAFIEFLKLGATTESNQINLSSIIRNDDFLNLTVTNTTDTDAACSGFSEESGCNVFSISWGSQVVDADTGDIIVPLSLPLLTSHTRYAADGSTNPKDYSVKLDGSEITYSDGANSLNLGAGLAADDSIPLIVDIATDNFVEPEEALTVSLNAAGSPYVAKINDNAAVEQILSHTIPIDDLLTVTVTGSGTSGVEAGDLSGVAAPFTYTTDNAVAANTPAISVLNTAGCTVPCATSGSDFTLTTDVSLHSNNYTPALSGTTNWPVAIQPDSIVEQDEKVSIVLSPSSLTPKAGDYVRFKHSGAAAGTELALAYTIENVDELALAISEITNGDCGATGLTAETGCREFDISWTQEIEGLTNPVIGITTTGSTVVNADETQEIGLSNTVVSPKDYSLTLDSSDITDQTSFSLDINNASNHIFKVSLIDDDFVELAEVLSLYLSTDTSYVSAPEDSIFSAAGKINHTIPAASDQVTITVNSATSSPEPSDTGGLTAPFTFTTDKFIAANVPAINLTVSGAACASNCAESGAGKDYTLPTSAISIHTNGEYSSKVVSDTDLGVAILDDNIIEAAENVKLSLSVDETSYALLAPSNPAYVISNVDLLDITITELSGVDTTCTGFSDEKGCREFELSWINELQSGSASLELKSSGDNKAVSIESRDTNDSNVISDPQDYYLDATNVTGTESNIDGTTITIEDTDGVAETKSMKVSINLNDDDFVEPKEQLSLYFGKPSGANSIGVISDFTASNHTIEYEIPIDDVLSITFTGSGTSGGEPQYDVNGLVDGTVEKPFTYTTNAPIAANTPTIALNLSKRTCDTSPCATLGTGNDFTVGSTTGLHVGSTAEVSGVYKPIHTKSLDVIIIDDQIVEVDESIKVRVTESSSYIDAIGNTDMTFTINSNDITTLSITSLSCTGGTTTVEELDANDKCIFKLNNSNEIDKYVPNLYVNLNFISGLGYATLDSDYTVDDDESGSTGLFKIKSYNSKLDATDIEVDIDIKADDLIEFNEVIQPVLSTATDSNSKIYTSVSENRAYKVVIENNDKINAVLTNATISEENEPTIDLEWVYGSEANFSLALADTASDFIFSVIQSNSDIATKDTDYTLANKTLSLSNGGTATSGALTGMAAIIDDNVIEIDESLNLTLSVALESTLAESLPDTASAADVINITTASKSYTILDGDDLSVEAAKFINEGNDSVNNMSYSINICKPANDYSIENYSGNAESIALSFNVNTTTNPADNTGYNKTYSNAVCGNDPQIHDYACANTQSKTLALSSFDNSECVVIPSLYSVYSDEIPEANKHIQHTLTVPASEHRISGFSMQQLTIVNDDFNPVTDTGLKHCVEAVTSNQRDIVDCDDSNSFHLKQDTLATADSTTYPGLAYTQVDETGDPAFTASDYTYVNSECFQDNHTGIWWTGTISDPSDSANKFSQVDDYTVFLPDAICGQNKSNWQLPTVQDLMSVTIVKHAFANNMTTPKSTHRETSAYQTAATQTVTFADGTTTITYDKFYKSAYWTSDACSSDGVTGYWTVDFFTAELACEDAANTNFKSLVYKPQ